MIARAYNAPTVIDGDISISKEKAESPTAAVSQFHAFQAMLLLDPAENMVLAIPYRIAHGHIAFGWRARWTLIRLIPRAFAMPDGPMPDAAMSRIRSGAIFVGRPLPA